MNHKSAGKSKKISLILILVLVAGLTLLLYPVISDYWNSLHQSHVIGSYAEAVAGLEDDSYEAMWAEAEAYNAALPRG